MLRNNMKRETRIKLLYCGIKIEFDQNKKTFLCGHNHVALSYILMTFNAAL